MLVETRIEPRRGWRGFGLRELFDYRELVLFLTWRDVKVRYKQTLLGMSWAILQPVLTMVVFSLFFGNLADVPSDGLPYPLFSLAALLPWTFFAVGLQTSALSLVNASSLISRVYLPRLAIPIAAVLGGGVDLAVSFSVLIVMQLSYGIGPGIAILLLPLFVLLAFTTCLGAGLWLSALNVRYRDVRYVVPFLTQLWLFLTPVAYPSSLLDEPWRTIYGINPMVGVVEGFRWALLGTDTAPGWTVVVSAVAAVAMLVGGMAYFRRVERVFADVV